MGNVTPIYIESCLKSFEVLQNRTAKGRANAAVGRRARGLIGRIKAAKANAHRHDGIGTARSSMGRKPAVHYDQRVGGNAGRKCQFDARALMAAFCAFRQQRPATRGESSIYSGADSIGDLSAIESTICNVVAHRSAQRGSDQNPCLPIAFCMRMHGLKTQVSRLSIRRSW